MKPETHIYFFLALLILKILQLYVFKMAANGSCRFEINIKTENYTSQFMSKKHVILVYYVDDHFMGLFYEYCTCSFRRHYWGKKSISTVSQRHHNLTDFLIPSLTFHRLSAIVF